MPTIDELKDAPSRLGTLKYKLKHATVFTGPGGYHFTDYLDSIEEVAPEIDPSALTPEISAYIENKLQSNCARFKSHVDLVRTHRDLEGARCLDIGCGGGLFLSLLAARGAEVWGIELSDSRAHYAATTHDLRVLKHPVESPYWQESYSGFFDVITLWDVIEHVNYPLGTLRSAARLLKDGGWILLDTPCRDAFYYRFGAFTYRVSGGRRPTFLNAMYSNARFGHKQIFSMSEMETLLGDVGVDVVNSRRIHELSFPYEFYLRNLIRSEVAVRMAAPLVALTFKVLKIKNKMVIVGKKRGG